MWFGVAARTDTKAKEICLKEIGLHVQNMITVLGSIVNMIEVGGLVINEHKNLHFNK